MIVLGFTLALTLIAAGLAFAAWRRSPALLADGFKDARTQFISLSLPRLAIGVLGSGFLAHLLPKETILAWLGRIPPARHGARQRSPARLTRAARL